ncbi:MAG: hypothetical protein ACP5E3_02325 [Bacteroidales bacterium]
MKFIKILIAVLFIIGIIFFGGAFLLPQEHYYAKTISLNNDPVAIFNKINQISALENITQNVLEKDNDSIIITSAEKYKSVQYKYISSNKIKSYQGGFIIEKEEQETRLTWFYSKDSLEFPLNRWRGFFDARVLEEQMENNLNKLEKIINK